jgi:hypothetical protein
VDKESRPSGKDDMIVQISGEYDDSVANGTLYWGLFADGGIAYVTHEVGLASLEMAQTKSLRLGRLLFAQSQPHLAHFHFLLVEKGRFCYFFDCALKLLA